MVSCNFQNLSRTTSKASAFPVMFWTVFIISVVLKSAKSVWERRISYSCSSYHRGADSHAVN